MAQELQIVPQGVLMHPLLTQIRIPLQTKHRLEMPLAASSGMLFMTFDGSGRLIFLTLTIGISTSSSSSSSNDTETDVLESIVVIVIDSAPTTTSVSGPCGITSANVPSDICTLYPLTRAICPPKA